MGNKREKRLNGNNREGSQRGTVSSEVGTTTPMPQTPSDQAEDISQAPSSADSNVTAAIRINQQTTSPSCNGDKPRSVSPSLYIVRHRSPIKSPSFDELPSAQPSSS